MGNDGERLAKMRALVANAAAVLHPLGCIAITCQWEDIIKCKEMVTANSLQLHHPYYFATAPYISDARHDKYQIVSAMIAQMHCISI